MSVDNTQSKIYKLIQKSIQIHSLLDCLGLIPESGKKPWRRKWQPAPVYLPGESHGQRSLAGLQPTGSQRVGHNLVNKTTISQRYGLQNFFMISSSPDTQKCQELLYQRMEFARNVSYEQYKDNYKLRGLILPVKNKGTDLHSIFLRAFSLENLRL